MFDGHVPVPIKIGWISAIKANTAMMARPTRPIRFSTNSPQFFLKDCHQSRRRIRHNGSSMTSWRSVPVMGSCWVVAMTSTLRRRRDANPRVEDAVEDVGHQVPHQGEHACEGKGGDGQWCVSD